ncbi:hypothetical protein [Brucella intermedia]|uniref:hypothetical protein n=1 Tax=Brucella intermedia TaxID=94625 RepID=UPI00124C0163|nr:hypothetical protein [Brucella intermedia]KAB2733644.1 hypothetical protein F9L02_01320 [Brucella intermedia]
MTPTISLIRGLHPIREGRNIFVEVEGQRVELSPMQASLIAQAWGAAVGGALVALSVEAERLGHDPGDHDSREQNEGDP